VWGVINSYVHHTQSRANDGDQGVVYGPPGYFKVTRLIVFYANAPNAIHAIIEYSAHNDLLLFAVWHLRSALPAKGTLCEAVFLLINLASNNIANFYDRLGRFWHEWRKKWEHVPHAFPNFYLNVHTCLFCLFSQSSRVAQ